MGVPREKTIWRIQLYIRISLCAVLDVLSRPIIFEISPSIDNLPCGTQNLHEALWSAFVRLSFLPFVNSELGDKQIPLDPCSALGTPGVSPTEAQSTSSFSTPHHFTAHHIFPAVHRSFLDWEQLALADPLPKVCDRSIATFPPKAASSHCLATRD